MNTKIPCPNNSDFPTQSKCEIWFPTISKKITAFTGVSLIHAIRQSGVPLAAPCGGRGLCGKCRVIASGRLDELQPNEMAILSPEDVASGFRLACSATVQGDVTVLLDTTQAVAVNTDGREEQNFDVGLDPLITSMNIRVSPPQSSDNCSDTRRAIDEIRRSYQKNCVVFDPLVVGQLSQILRQENWAVTGYLHKDELIGFSALGAVPVGAAFDLGSTTISGQLWDLENGIPMSGLTRLNPQVAYGADIMTRLQHALKEEGADELLSVVRQTLREILSGMAHAAGIYSDQIVEICLAGNTVMTHLLLGLPVRQLALAPYIPSTVGDMELLARDLGLSTAPGAKIHVLPGIGGFVGGDHVAMIISSDLDTTLELTLGIDIGTNTELVLSGPPLSQPICSSCPSGPVFEGMHVSCGSTAVPGAIAKITLVDGEIVCATVDNRPPIGICGTGIIDAISVMHRLGIINHRGKFTVDQKLNCSNNSQPHFIFESQHSGSSTRPVSITQKDVREVLLAKGAIAAAIRIMLDQAEISEDQVKKVVITGAFGGRLNVGNAQRIGMLPKFSEAEFAQIGNGSLAGVIKTLLLRQNRERAQQISRSATLVQLVNHANFDLRFAESINLPL